MGQDYRHFSLEERCQIAGLRAQGSSLRQIATALDRSPSSISRELKRNTGRSDYAPDQAEDKARARRWTGSKLERKQALRDAVLTALRQGLSPEQAAGMLARQAGERLVSHETIYRFIYAQIARHQDYSWRHYLPRAKAKRGFRGHRGGSSAKFIQNRVPISQRTREAEDRSIPGHWEADLMLFAKYGQAILTIHERTSRILLAQKPPNRTAALIPDSLCDLFESLPQPLRQTITFDNGAEFAHHFRLKQLAFKTFFCDTHSPWQKGGIENAIGRIRRFLPRKTDLDAVTQDHLNTLIAIYNNTPRKCLDFNTPAQVFLHQLLHFKCESTWPIMKGMCRHNPVTSFKKLPNRRRPEDGEQRYNAFRDCLSNLSDDDFNMVSRQLVDAFNRCHCGGKVKLTLGLDENGKFNLSAQRKEMDFITCRKCGDTKLYNLAAAVLAAAATLCDQRPA